jgi:hypothetical protein
VYDSTGKEVIVLENRYLHPGNYTSVFNPDNNYKGVYFIQLLTLSGVETLKCIIR